MKSVPMSVWKRDKRTKSRRRRRRRGVHYMKSGTMYVQKKPIEEEKKKE